MWKSSLTAINIHVVSTMRCSAPLCSGVRSACAFSLLPFYFRIINSSLDDLFYFVCAWLTLVVDYYTPHVYTLSYTHRTYDTHYFFFLPFFPGVHTILIAKLPFTQARRLNELAHDSRLKSKSTRKKPSGCFHFCWFHTIRLDVWCAQVLICADIASYLFKWNSF